MDLNQLLFHHQVALIRSGAPGTARSGPVPASPHFDLVAHYGKRIGRLRREMGVPRYPEWV